MSRREVFSEVACPSADVTKPGEHRRPRGFCFRVEGSFFVVLKDAFFVVSARYAMEALGCVWGLRIGLFSVVSSCRPRVRSQHRRSPSVEEVVEGVVVAEGRRRRPDRHGDRGAVDQLLQLDLLDLLVLLLQLIAELLQVSLSEMPEKNLLDYLAHGM